MRTFSRGLFTVALLLVMTVTWAGDFKKGWNAYSSTDYATALAEWQELADGGDPDACYGMGLLYGNGFGVDMNDELALKYYGVAANAGHAEAQYNLGIMHQNGWGVPINEEEGLKWYALAADQGIVGAQLALGRTYAMDFTDRYDPVLAYKWFSLAAKMGDIDAKARLEFVESRMTAEQIAAGKSEVDAWVADHQNLLADY